MLRHLPYFGDEENDSFDYLSYYDSNSLVQEDKDGSQAHFQTTFFFLFSDLTLCSSKDEYRTEAMLKILRTKNIPDNQILEMYRNDRKSEWSRKDHKVNDVVLALAKVFRVDPDTLAERIVAFLEKKPQPAPELPMRSIENIDK